MRYLPNIDRKEELLKEAGLKEADLFSDIPSEFLLEKANLPAPLSEIEVSRRLDSVLSQNKSLTTFLGGGFAPHYSPAHVGQLASRSEFYTAYTPYQPEISQGMLQTLFEYQSLVAELTGLPVVNTSLYEWSTALAEASFMCHRYTGRQEFLVPKIISPQRLRVLGTYAAPLDIKIKQVGYDEKGQLDLADLKKSLSSQTAGVYVESPTYLGYFADNIEEISDMAHKAGAQLVMGVDPISLGISRSPADYGADIAVGDAQTLGGPVSFGGPSVGIFAVRYDKDFIKKFPGRIIGVTDDPSGNRGFAMTLQTREQHIRRERATSNICSNEALSAVTAAIYLASLGSTGLEKLGKLIMANANYAMKKIGSLEGYESPIFDSLHFKEFTVCSTKLKQAHKKLIQNSIHGGSMVEGFPNTALYCVTESHTKEDIDRLLEVLSNV